MFAGLRLLLLAVAATGESIRQYPFFDVDGWSCHGRGCEGLRTLHGSLVGQDSGETAWFFSAPPHIVRELACASTVSFRMTHPEFDSQGRDALADFDVVVVSASLKLSLGLQNIVPSWAIVTDVSVSLDGSPQGGEQGKDVWKNTELGYIAEQSEVRSVLETASALLVRGSYYTGAEVTCIESFVLSMRDPCSSYWEEEERSSRVIRAVCDGQDAGTCGGGSANGRFFDASVPASLPTTVVGEPPASDDEREAVLPTVQWYSSEEEMNEQRAREEAAAHNREHLGRDADGHGVVESQKAEDQFGAEVDEGGRFKGTANMADAAEATDATEATEELVPRSDEKQDGTGDKVVFGRTHAPDDDGSAFFGSGANDSAERLLREREECLGLKERYKVEPCISWGEALQVFEVQERWAKLDCDSRLGVKCLFAHEDDASALSDAATAVGGGKGVEAVRELVSHGERCLMAARFKGSDSSFGSEGAKDTVEDDVAKMSAEEGYACAQAKFTQALAEGSARAAFRLAEMVDFAEASKVDGAADGFEEADGVGVASALSGSHGHVWSQYGAASDMGSEHAAYVMATTFALNSSIAETGCNRVVSAADAGAGDDDARAGGKVEEDIAAAILRDAAGRGSQLALLALAVFPPSPPPPSHTSLSPSRKARAQSPSSSRSCCTSSSVISDSCARHQTAPVV